MRADFLDKELYKTITNSICEYMEDKHDLHLGQFEAEFFLDELLKIITPAIYNKGIEDSILSLRSFNERLEEELDMRRII
ncbi:TPA: DUF2164 family protein [Klebsiella pneumoniae]|nr:DUF2164 family protein [Klebsiella pneumoniae]HDZ1813238.1 DUF2164 family protein [Klebsiella pneumoniae]